MLDIHSLLKNLKRPKLLVQAARFGLDEYRREVDLLRTLEITTLPRPVEGILQLIDLENELNEQRETKRSDYDMARHINAVTAIMAEQRLLETLSLPR